jgi:hypothetical protein
VTRILFSEPGSFSSGLDERTYALFINNLARFLADLPLMCEVSAVKRSDADPA